MVAEAVGDVGVEQSDLTRAVYKCLYRSTLDSLINSKKIPTGAPKLFLQKLLVRKPCVAVAEHEAQVWAVGHAQTMGLDMVKSAFMKKASGGGGDGGGGGGGGGGGKAMAKAAAAFAGSVKGGELEHARAWTTRLAEALVTSIEAEQTLLRLVTELTLADLRNVMRQLSSPPPGGKQIVLSQVVANGVGGVAKVNLLRKLDLAVVPLVNAPLYLNGAWRLLPGRGPFSESGSPYALPLRYAEGEERRRPDRDPTGPMLALLDAGQRLRPDGSELNVIRLHRIWCMQNATADGSAELTIEKMIDEHVTLTLRNSFFDRVGGGGEEDDNGEIVIKGKAEVMRYLISDGFAMLNVGGSVEAPKKRGEGLTYVQPCALTAEGDTRVVFGAGGREANGSTAERLRMGELIKWGPWGQALSIVRVFEPLETHYEWVYRNQVGNFAGIKASLDKGVLYFLLVHHRAPSHAACPPFAAKVLGGSKAVFERLDNELSRMTGHIGAISANLLGDKFDDLQARRARGAAAAATDDALGSRGGSRGGSGGGSGGGGAEASPEMAHMREIERRAYQTCVTWDSGSPGAGPDLSVVSFAGRWLPLGETPKRAGELVICVRETIGWKYQSKPPAKGDAKPTASRKIGMLMREVFIDTKLHEAPPFAPGLAPGWALYEQYGRQPDEVNSK